MRKVLLGGVASMITAELEAKTKQEEAAAFKLGGSKALEAYRAGMPLETLTELKA